MPMNIPVIAGASVLTGTAIYYALKYLFTSKPLAVSDSWLERERNSTRQSFDGVCWRWANTEAENKRIRGVSRLAERARTEHSDMSGSRNSSAHTQIRSHLKVSPNGNGRDERFFTFGGRHRRRKCTLT